MERLRRPRQAQRAQLRAPRAVVATSGPSAFGAGNAAVVQALRDGDVRVQRGLGSWVSNKLAAAVGDETPEMAQYNIDRDARQDFLDELVYGPQDVVPSTGIGGFGATYVPSVGVLDVTVRGAIDFQDGIVMNGTSAVAQQTSGGAQATAVAINALPVEQRAAQVALWHWDAAETAPWAEKFKTTIESTWAGKHEFRSSRRNWDDLGARTSVDVVVHPGAKTDGDHIGVTSYKVPVGGAAGVVGVVNSNGSGLLNTHGATDTTMTVNSTDLDPRTDGLATAHFDFDTDAATVKASSTPTVLQVAIAMRKASSCSICKADLGAGSPVVVAVQGVDEAAAQARFDALKAQFAAVDNGGAASRLAFRYGGTGDGADSDAVDGKPQTIIAHEAGHVFGLGDEYATDPGGGLGGTGANAGGATRSDQVVQDAGLPGSHFENDDGIMSMGTDVREQHYATFLEALKTITDESQWVLGEPQPVRPPGEEPAGVEPLPVAPGSAPAEPASATA